MKNNSNDMLDKLINGIVESVLTVLGGFVLDENKENDENETYVLTEKGRDYIDFIHGEYPDFNENDYDDDGDYIYSDDFDDWYDEEDDEDLDDELEDEENWLDDEDLSFEFVDYLLGDDD